MRISVLILVFFWFLLGSGVQDPVRGQGSEPGCLEPLPHPFSFGIPPLVGQREGQPPPPRPGLYVSPRGRLCRAFQPLSPERSPFQASSDRTPDPGKAFLFSVLVPGAGQWYQGQERWPAYMAVEAWAWIQFLDWRREGHNLQQRFRDLAWLVARRISSGPRIEGGWEYYEALTHFRSSGAYDTDPLRPKVQPESDPSTFNGSIWALAQEIFFPEDSETPPEEGSEPYNLAYAYYLSRAYRSEFAWDWGTNNLHQEEYTALIRDSDEALRSSTGMIGLILANHLLSAVDALVSGRLGIAGEAEPSLQFMLVPGPYNTRGLGVQLRLPTARDHDF